MSTARLVLASASPRRLELLGRLGLDPVVHPADIDESWRPGEPGPLHALRVAREKAQAVARLYPLHPVLGADTAVVLGAQVFGKPSSRAEARAMLTALRARAHVVVTAACVRHVDREASVLVHADVTFAAFPDALLDWYVETGEGDDKAGAYAVQGRGAILVERVAGNVQAVVGLPLAVLPALFEQVGLRLEPDGDRLRLRDMKTR